jgi:hypothetical protein
MPRRQCPLNKQMVVVDILSTIASPRQSQRSYARRIAQRIQPFLNTEIFFELWFDGGLAGLPQRALGGMMKSQG